MRYLLPTLLLFLLPLIALAQSTPSESDNNISLKELMDVRFEAQNDKFDRALANQEKAVAVADELRKERERLVAKLEDEQRVKRESLDERLKGLENKDSATNTVWIYIVAGLTIIGAILTSFLNIRAIRRNGHATKGETKWINHPQRSPPRSSRLQR